MELDGSFWGPAEGIPGERIVFLHGMGGTGKLWRPIAAHLEDHYRIFAPDQRGHGRSRVPQGSGNPDLPSYSPLDYGQDLVDSLEISQFHPTWVVGHSMGVRSACAFAHLRPDWACGLVLVDLGFEGPAGGGLGDALAGFLQKLPSTFASRAEARAFMALECPDPAIAQYLMAVSELDPLSGEVSYPFDHSALIKTIHAARDSSVRSQVRALGARSMPILVLRGANSLVWSHEEYEQEKSFFTDLPSVRFLEIEGAGHGLPFERRVEFVRVLREFVEAGG